MRLQKYMAHAGIASRRKSEKIISKRRVKVNGDIITNPAYKVKEDDVVEVDGREIFIDKKFDYFILNKPLGVFSTVTDDLNRKTVVDIINTHHRIYPVGRLDMDSEGLILLTNDGELTNIMTHPRYEISKKYIVRINGNPTEKELNILRNGIFMDGSKTNKSFIEKIRSSQKSILSIEIDEGKNRQVRRMFEYIDYKILNLTRVQFGELYLGSLKSGEYRKLTNREKEYIQRLKNKYD